MKVSNSIRLATRLKCHSLLLRMDPFTLVINAAGTSYNAPNAIVYSQQGDFTSNGTAIIAAYQQWRIDRITVRLTPLTTQTGASAIGFAEELQTNAAWSAQANRRVIPNSNVSKANYTFKWQANSPENLNFVTTSTALPSPIYFQFYTDTSYGTQPTVAITSVFYCEPSAVVELMYLGT